MPGEALEEADPAACSLHLAQVKVRVCNAKT
jgi:hypothetical protein